MILIILSIGFLFIVLRTVQSAWFSPLSAFPNAHFLAPFTPLWLLWIKYTKRENRVRNSLHEKLGPVMRIGPSELSINDIRSVKAVYGGGFDKTGWYSSFGRYGEDTLFSTIESKPHSERKRMLSHVYSKSQIQNSPELGAIFDTLATNANKELQFYADANRAIDFYKLTKSYGMDATTAYLFGLGLGTNFIQDSRNGDPLQIFEVGVKPEDVFYHSEAPGARKWMERFGIQPIPNEVAVAAKSMEELCWGMCEKSKKAILEVEGRSGSTDKKTTHPTVYAQLYNKLKESGYSGTKLDNITAAEMLDEMIAGNELIGINLSYLTWELSIHPETHQRLQEEIGNCLSQHRNSGSSSLLPSGQIIDALPILDAAILETLRVHPEGFGPFPRIVPPGGAEIEGVRVPAGTVISAANYTLHKNPTVFPEPEKWRPERWTDASDEEKREMMRWFWAFGSGGRMCIGKHLADRVLKSFMVAVYTAFEYSLAGEKMPEQDNVFFGIPEGNKVFMKVQQIT